MLDPHTEHATQLRNHWYWRPGHRPGRPFYTWHLTFESCTELHQLVSAYQAALRHVPGLDPVPLPWLHITMQGIGFADEVSDTDRDAIIAAARERLSRLPTPTLTFCHATIRPEAISLYPHPSEPVHAIRTELRKAIGEVWGLACIPEPALGYQPHLSVAYVNHRARLTHIAAALSAVQAPPANFLVRSAACIALQRHGRTYEWHTRAIVPLMP